MATIMISAGEVSGDVHGAKLVQEIKKLDPSISFFGMGHTRLKNEGVRIDADLATVSTIGFVEPLRYIPKILCTYFKMKKLMAEQKPDVLVPIDYQGYHMVLLGAAKKLNIPAIYYISPQEWQWGTEQGGKNVVAVTDKILSIFKEEVAFYNSLGGNAVYVGHPLLDLAQSDIGKDEFCKKYHLDSSKKIVSIFPGSRPQEIRLTFPILLEAASQILQKAPNVQIIVSISSEKFENEIRTRVSKNPLFKKVIFYKDNQYDLIANSYLSLTTSGTVTLEHAILETPCLVAYKFGRVSFWLAKKLIGEKFKKIKFIALPNILLREEVVPEFLQDACDPSKIAKKALSLLTDETKYKEIKQNLLRVKDMLGSPGAVKRSAQEIVNFIHSRNK